jgi:hypothetical protein
VSLPPRFLDIAADAGIAFRHTNGASAKKYLVETMGSGAGVLDYDGDGRSDIVLLDDHQLVPFSRPARSTVRLYRNLTAPGMAPRFEDVTAQVGLDCHEYTMGCAAGDFDGDGRTDLYVSAVLGTGRLYQNRGSRFEDVTTTAGVQLPGKWGSGCAWLDFDQDGQLDLYVASYVRYPSLAADVPCFLRGQERSYCIPAAYAGASGTLFRNLGGGRFQDVTRTAGVFDAGQKGLGVLATDLNDDGWTDLLIANDTVPNRLFVNQRGRFREDAEMAGVAYGAGGKARGGMGVDAADWANTGAASAVVTNFSGESIGFFAPEGAEKGIFSDRAGEVGVAGPSQRYVGFGVRFLDAENDGFEELCAVNGHIRDDIDRLEPGQTYAQPALLFQNVGGQRLADVTQGTGAPVASGGVRRGLVSADFDADGRVDLLVTRNGGPAELWLNQTETANHWLAVRLVGRKSNRDGVGARVTLRVGGKTQTRWITSGGSYLCESERTAHFGLGTASKVDELAARWPGGAAQTVTVTGVDRRITVVEGPAP